MKRFFKNLKAMALVAVVGVAAVSCAEAYDDTELKQQVADLAERVSNLEERLNSEVTALRALIDEKVALAEVQEDGAWKFTLADGKDLTLYPEYVENGLTVVTEDGVQYWAKVEGNVTTILTDAAGNKVAFHNAPELRVTAENIIEVSVDGGKSWVATQAPSLFAAIDVKDNHACLTLQNGKELKFALYEQVSFNVNGNALYIAPLESEKVTMTLDGIVEILPLVVPEGWSVKIDGLIMTVTAPEASGEEDDDMMGGMPGMPGMPGMGGGEEEATPVIKVLALSKEGKAFVASLYVYVAADGVQSLKVAGDDVIITNYKETIVGYERPSWTPIYGPAPIAYAAFPTGEYTIEEFLKATSAYPSTYKYQVCYIEEQGGVISIPILDVLKNTCGVEQIERGDSYTILAFDPNAYPLDETAIMMDVYSATYLDIAMTSNSFKDIQIDITIEGYTDYEIFAYDNSWPPYYGAEETFEEIVAMVKDMEDMGATDEQIEQQLKYMSWGIKKNGNYSGSLFDLGGDFYAGADKTYVMYVWPKSAMKKISSYKWEDVKGPYTFKTKGYEAGGMLQPTFGLIESYDGMLPEVTYQGANIAVVPAKGSYMTVGYYFAPEALKGMSDADIVSEALKNGSMIQGDEYNAELYIDGLMPETTITVVGFSVDQDGKYGPIIKKDLTTKKLDYSTTTLEITDWKLVEPTYDMKPTDSFYSFNVKPTGETKNIYFQLCETNEYTITNKVLMEAVMAVLNRETDYSLNNNFIDITTLPKNESGAYAPVGNVATLGGSMTTVGLEPGKTYMVIVVGLGADDLPTQAAYYEFDTIVKLNFFTKDNAKWTATQPTVTISEELTTTQSYPEYMEGEELSGEALTYPAYATKEVTIKLAEGCTEFIVGCLSSEVSYSKSEVATRTWLEKMINQADAWPEDNKMMSGMYYKHTGNEFTFTSCEMATWVSWDLDITWKDAEGNWYESTLVELHKEHTPEGLPQSGDGGIAL